MVISVDIRLFVVQSIGLLGMTMLHLSNLKQVLLHYSGLAYISVYAKVMGLNFLEEKILLTPRTFQSTKQKESLRCWYHLRLGSLFHFLDLLFQSVCCITALHILFSHLVPSISGSPFYLPWDVAFTFSLLRKVLSLFGIRAYFFISLWYAVLLVIPLEGNCLNHLEESSNLYFISWRFFQKPKGQTLKQSNLITKRSLWFKVWSIDFAT